MTNSNKLRRNTKVN